MPQIGANLLSPSQSASAQNASKAAQNSARESEGSGNESAQGAQSFAGVLNQHMEKNTSSKEAQSKPEAKSTDKPSSQAASQVTKQSAAKSGSADKAANEEDAQSADLQHAQEDTLTTTPVALALPLPLLIDLSDASPILLPNMAQAAIAKGTGKLEALPAEIAFNPGEFSLTGEAEKSLTEGGTNLFQGAGIEAKPEREQLLGRPTLDAKSAEFAALRATDAAAGEQISPNSTAATLSELAVDSDLFGNSGQLNGVGGMPGIAEAANAAQSKAAAGTPLMMRVETPVSHPGWNRDIGQQLIWMAQGDRTHAEITLTPAHLGRIEVSLSMQGDQATASFVAASPAAREALEQSLPRLREMFAEAGISLGQTQVGAEHAAGQEQQAGRFAKHANGSVEADTQGATQASANWSNPQRAGMGIGLVDTFA